MTTNKNYPKSFSHIGLTVPNIKEAVKFYSEVMGCRNEFVYCRIPSRS